MSERTQIAIQVKFKSNDKTFVQREIFDYQFGACNEKMFEDLLCLLLKSKSFIETFNTNSDYEGYSLLKNIEFTQYYENPLLMCFINQLKSKHNYKLSTNSAIIDFKDKGKFEENPFNMMTDEVFKQELFSAQNDGGYIFVDIFLDGTQNNNSWCKWCFLDRETHQPVKTFKNIINNKHYLLDENAKRSLKKLLFLIKAISTEDNKYIGYDWKFF